MSCITLFWYCWALDRACYQEHASKHHDIMKSCAYVAACFKRYERGECEDVLPNHETPKTNPKPRSKP